MDDLLWIAKWSWLVVMTGWALLLLGVHLVRAGAWCSAVDHHAWKRIAPMRFRDWVGQPPNMWRYRCRRCGVTQVDVPKFVPGDPEYEGPRPRPIGGGLSDG